MIIIPCLCLAFLCGWIVGWFRSVQLKRVMKLPIFIITSLCLMSMFVLRIIMSKGSIYGVKKNEVCPHDRWTRVIMCRVRVVSRFCAPFNFYDYHVGIHKESDLLKQKAVLLTDSNI